MEISHSFGYLKIIADVILTRMFSLEEIYLFQAATRTLRTTHACEAQVAERSFSRLPTHPYVQWWNAAFATIVNAHLLPSLRSLSLCSS